MFYSLSSTVWFSSLLKIKWKNYDLSCGLLGIKSNLSIVTQLCLGGTTCRPSNSQLEVIRNTKVSVENIENWAMEIVKYENNCSPLSPCPDWYYSQTSDIYTGAGTDARRLCEWGFTVCSDSKPLLLLPLHTPRFGLLVISEVIITMIIIIIFKNKQTPKE